MLFVGSSVFFMSCNSCEHRLFVAGSRPLILVPMGFRANGCRPPRCLSAHYRGRFPGLACEGRTCRATTPKWFHNRADRDSGSTCFFALSSTYFLFAVAFMPLSRASAAETANSQGNGKCFARRILLVAIKSSRCSPIHIGACSNR